MILNHLSPLALRSREAPPDAVVFPDQTLLEVLPAAVYVCDADGVIVRYNRKAAEFWGREPLLGDSDQRFCGAFRLFRPDGRELPHDRTPMADVLRTGIPARDNEVIIEQPSGARLWAQVSIEPLFGPDGTLAGAINCFQNITPRKQAEAAERQSRQLLQAIFEATPEAIKVVDAAGRLIEINPAARAATAEKAVVGGLAADVAAPEDREAWRRNHRAVCAGEKRLWEFDVVEPGGERRRMALHACPLTLPDGARGMLAVMRDITRHRQYEEALREGERRLREILEALPVALYTTDAEARITFYNEAAVDLWGYRPELGDLWCGSWRIYTPDGRLLPHEQCPMAVALKEKRPVRNIEAVVERPDGSRVPFMPYPTPLFDGAGRLVGAVNMLVDISHHKRAADRQQLLINELNHRVKNTLATVQSIAHLTLRSATSPERFRDAFCKRIAALSTAHDLLTSNQWEGAGLATLLDRELAAYIAEDAGRVALRGPEVRLDPRQTLTLAMAFHELATNAAKYGALSCPSGRLAVSWTVEGDGLRLVWSERGGPPVAAPVQKGFGSILLERSLAGELGGRVGLDFAERGLICSITASLRRPPNAA